MRSRWFRIVLGFGAFVTIVLLGREVSDYVNDFKHPVLRANDLYSALGSVAMLVIIGFAYLASIKRANANG